MFMIFKKRTVLTIVLFLAVAAAATLAYYYSPAEQVSGDVESDEFEPVGRAEMVSAEDDYFASAKAKRQSDRDSAISLLNDTVNNSASSAQARQDASDKIAEIADNIVRESAIEDLLRAKGFADAVVYIADTEVNAAVAAKELTEADVSKIRDVIIAQTNNNNIKIVAVE